MSLATPPRGFVMEPPEALLQGAHYIPLMRQIPLPGGAIMLRSGGEDGERLFGELARKKDLFVTVLMRSQQPTAQGTLDLHEVGILSLVSEHRRVPDGSFQTLIAGIGRVSLSTPYLFDGEPLPRMDVIPLSSRCEEEGAAQQRLLDLVTIFTSGLGHINPEFSSMLLAFATQSADPSLNIDRVAGIIADAKPALLQRFIATLELEQRLDLLEHELLEALVRIQNGQGSASLKPD